MARRSCLRQWCGYTLNSAAPSVTSQCRAAIILPRALVAAAAAAVGDLPRRRRCPLHHAQMHRRRAHEQLLLSAAVTASGEAAARPAVTGAQAGGARGGGDDWQDEDRAPDSRWSAWTAMTEASHRAVHSSSQLPAVAIWSALALAADPGQWCGWLR